MDDITVYTVPRSKRAKVGHSYMNHPNVGTYGNYLKGGYTDEKTKGNPHPGDKKRC